MSARPGICVVSSFSPAESSSDAVGLSVASGFVGSGM